MNFFQIYCKFYHEFEKVNTTLHCHHFLRAYNIPLKYKGQTLNKYP